ncbi:MAG: hypothetical protein BHV87_07925 [Clostridiales bacterium 36_14]|jgi:hypothetical protein|nr:MAG: hypothetical protein BHV87_07925 [Clostridiales bacterium 36_14]DAS27727.1 MAG TPA: protein of unknown function (DUF5361) [Caudoviricetes sp.]
MMVIDEDALICDLAETYHIFDYRELPCTKVALFAAGLRENSRIKMKIAGMKYPLETMVEVAMLDRVSVLLWMQTKDGQNGTNRPESVMAKLLGQQPDKEVVAFRSGEDFEKCWNAITEGAE